MGEAVSTAALTVEHIVILTITICIVIIARIVSSKLLSHLYHGLLQVEDIGEKFPESRGELRFLVPLQVV